MENKVYEYKGKLYSNNRCIDNDTYSGNLKDLISLLMDDLIITDYHGECWVEGDFIGDMSEVSEEEVLDYTADYSGEIDRIERND